MTTMTFPITEVTLPTDEWEMKSFKEARAFSEETICFTATMVHKPTGRKFAVKNDGRGGSHMIEPFGKDSYAGMKAVVAEWEKFVAQCGDTLRKSVENGLDWQRDLYNDFESSDPSMNSDSVIDLFVGEMDNQGALSRKRGTVVRTPESRSAFQVWSNYTPAQMAGNVVGEYWDKKVKNWVTI